MSDRRTASFRREIVAEGGGFRVRVVHTADDPARLHGPSKSHILYAHAMGEHAPLRITRLVIGYIGCTARGNGLVASEGAVLQKTGMECGQIAEDQGRRQCHNLIAYMISRADYMR